MSKKLSSTQRIFIADHVGGIYQRSDAPRTHFALKEAGMIETVYMRHGVFHLLNENAYRAYGYDEFSTLYNLAAAYKLAAQEAEKNIIIRLYRVRYSHTSDNIHDGIDVYEMSQYPGSVNEQSDWIAQAAYLWEQAVKWKLRLDRYRRDRSEQGLSLSKYLLSS